MKALVSVSNKEGLLPFVKSLVEYGYDIISTGGTKSYLIENGVSVTGVEEITKFPEMLDGRVKTLHPNIHGGILAKRTDEAHMTTLKSHHIEKIDLVVVNLYPFKETVLKPGTTHDHIIENIDIGGPAMVRSSAKNYESVAIVVDPGDYAVVLDEISVHGFITPERRLKLAAKAFRHTARYDTMVANYMTNVAGEDVVESLTLSFDTKQALRYGENGHQKAVFYADVFSKENGITSAKQLHGKELSYNNIKDADAAIKIAREFKEPVCVAVKHMNPCGVGSGQTAEEAFDRCYAADPVSIFGGIVVFNRPITESIAQKLNQIFLEIIIAPEFEPNALAILTQKKNLRLLTLNIVPNVKRQMKSRSIDKEFVSVSGGLLVQDEDVHEDSVRRVVTTASPSEILQESLEFGWKVVKHVKSNAIVVAENGQTLGIGAGQMNRVGAAKIALEQAKAHLIAKAGLNDVNISNDMLKILFAGVVLASDAFFPMSDTVELAASYGINAIIQPGGSIKDAESIDACNRYGIAMVMTDMRHFKH